MHLLLVAMPFVPSVLATNSKGATMGHLWPCTPPAPEEGDEGFLNFMEFARTTLCEAPLSAETNKHFGEKRRLNSGDE